MCVCRPNLGFSNLDHFRMLGWYQNDPLIILGLAQVLVCAGVQVLVDKIWILSLYYMCVWHFCKFEQIKFCPKIMKPIPVCRAEFCEFIGFWIITNGFLNRSLGRSKDLSIWKIRTKMEKVPPHNWRGSSWLGQVAVGIDVVAWTGQCARIERSEG